MLWQSDCITSLPLYSQQTQDAEPMLVWCWSSVYNAGPTSNQHWLKILCFLSCCPWLGTFHAEWSFIAIPIPFRPTTLSESKHLAGKPCPSICSCPAQRQYQYKNKREKWMLYFWTKKITYTDFCLSFSWCIIPAKWIIIVWKSLELWHF